MNRTKLFSLIMLLVISITTSCNNQPDNNQETNANIFTIKDMILPESRAPQMDENGAGNFIDGDKNTIFFLSEEEGITDKFVYTYGQKYYWSKLPITSKSEELSVSACYPNVDTDTPNDFEWDVREKNNDIDFLFSTQTSIKKGTSSPIELKFTHALHKLKVNVSADKSTISEEQIEGVSITCIDFKPIAHLNLLTGKAVSASGDASSIESKDSKAEFIIPSQEIGNIKLLIKLGNREKMYELSNSIVNGTPLTILESGKSLSINITVSEKDFIISGQSISGWDNQGEINDSIII